MRDETVARNYAETLFELASRNDALQEYGDAIEAVAKLIDEDAKFRLFMETPRIDDADKKAVVRKAFADSLPKHVVNFILVTIDKRRQRLLRSISQQYHALLDAHMGREHVQVTVARPMDDTTHEVITQKLSAALGKEAIPHVRVDAGIVGGLVLRTGNTIYDGSIRRRLEGMRRRLLAADLPTDSGDAATA
ncbi:MAG: ATP synthase F1 subunit delta [Gemmatimonadota bacterium]|nr:ATP synthase F1 subunit delta [Gemmatimonadota bacterium]MDE3007063.1 ATP synthase F1 subunit delta [Gemmatimonadota bacterium]MDE3013020.1 ATP synthase F1 subunit delta [Gemmatimonadota bacterium]